LKNDLIVTEGLWCGQRKPEFDGGIHPVGRLGDDVGAVRHASQIVACIAMVLLNTDRMGLANEVAFSGQDFCEGIPIVGLEDAVFQGLDLGIERPEGRSITTTEHPGDRSP